MALAAPIEDGVIDLLCRLRVSPELRAALEAEARIYLAQERPRLGRTDVDRALRELKQRFLDEAISATGV
jgi:hypothetical protein